MAPKKSAPAAAAKSWNGVETFKGKRVGVCVSGGLDSKTVCKRLVMEGIDVLAFSADLGQPDECASRFDPQPACLARLGPTLGTPFAGRTSRT